MDKTLTEMADAQPDLPDRTRGDRSWRQATALVEVCTSGGGEDAPPAQVTVFVDAAEAAESNGEAGVMLEAGPKVGVQALEAILCDASTEVTVNGDDGIPMVYGRGARTAPPGLKRAVIRRGGGGFVKPTDATVALVIHQRGLQIYRHPDHGRIRFRRPKPRAKPPDRPSRE